MKTAELMTREVVTVTPETSVKSAAQLMLQYNVSGLPVVEDSGKLVGIVTEGDLLRRSETGTERHRGRWLELFVGPGQIADEYIHACGRKVGEVMTPDVYAVPEDASLEALVALMEQYHIRRLPVTRDGHVIGIVSRANLLHALIAGFPQPVTEVVTDVEIGSRIREELTRQHWAPRGIKVSVQDGVAELQGVIVDERHRTALCVLAENTPGVKEVRDSLLWMDPGTGLLLNPGE